MIFLAGICAGIAAVVFVIMITIVFSLNKISSMCSQVEDKRKPLISKPLDTCSFLYELEKLSTEFHKFDCSDNCKDCILHKEEIDNVTICDFLFGLTEEGEER